MEDSLDELGELARSAGATVVGAITQSLDRPSNTYIGAGKLEELAELIKRKDIDTVICDDELDPTQQRNIEKVVAKLRPDSGREVKVIDRTALILDVFARRAQTHEGRLQVDLAQHDYLLPRLAGQWSHLERLGGGIGTRGPGETQIESDRRLIRGRILKIKKDLEAVRRHRALYINRRKEARIPVASLVGYTNAGKSTLMNSLTRSTVLAKDQLFSTLDPVTRKLRLPSGREILLTDTVGFIQKLPTSIVAAFRATLEEIQDSAVIVHVVDITHPNADAQSDEVDRILREIAVIDKPRVLALNKADKMSGGTDPGAAARDGPGSKEEGQPPAVLISALKGFGLDLLLQEIESAVQQAETLGASHSSGELAAAT